MKQREMPVLALARGLKMAPWDLVRSCRDELAAVHLCIQLSGYSDESVAGFLGIDKGHWSRMMHGRAHFPTRKQRALMEVCGNLAPLQYLAWASGYDLQERDKDARIRELEAELAGLRRAS